MRWLPNSSAAPMGGARTMSDRENRDFQAGLEDEVNAFLRGEPTRRTFIKRFGQAMGMLPIAGGMLGSGVQWALAQAKMELEDPSTPLGKAQALALKASTEGPARRFGLPRRGGSQAVCRRQPQHDLRGRSAGSRPAQLLRPALGAADRHQVDRRRAAVAGHVFQADRRAHRAVGRLRHPRPAAAVDARRSPTAA